MEQVNGQLPNFLKLIMVFVDRVGFPVLAFCLMCYFAFFSLQKTTDALMDNTRILSVTATASQEMLRTVQVNQGIIIADLKTIMTKK